MEFPKVNSMTHLKKWIDSLLESILFADKTVSCFLAKMLMINTQYQILFFLSCINVTLTDGKVTWDSSGSLPTNWLYIYMKQRQAFMWLHTAHCNQKGLCDSRCGNDHHHHSHKILMGGGGPVYFSLVHSQCSTVSHHIYRRYWDVSRCELL